MSSNALVSVTIIFLNEERFLAEAIDSVLAQTYDQWELLLVDDGSTDKSTGIAQAYAERHPGKVRYLEHPGHQNRGMAASRNLGLRNSGGDFIARLDADDVCLPNTLEEQVKIFDAHPRAGMVYGPARMWFSWTGDPEDAKRDATQRLSLPPHTLVEPPTALTRFIRDEGDEPFGMVIRRDAMEAVGGYEEAVTSTYEDQALNVKVCLRYPVVVADRNWFKYRQHPQSHCSVAKQEGTYNSGRLLFLNWTSKYLTEQGIENAEIWHAVNEALSRQRDTLWRQQHPRLHRLKELARVVAQRTLPGPARRWVRDQYLNRQVGKLDSRV